jgi:acyl-coenzyme A synthetase/AMP-(fatty) acid ligase
MPPPENLRATIGEGIAERFLRSADRSVRIADLECATSLRGRRDAFAGRSVLVAPRDQFAAALTLIELDGLARRLLLCPPGLAPDHLAALVADAEIDAVVSDGEEDEYAALGIALRATLDTRLAAAGHSCSGGGHTEWLLLTSGTSGTPKLVRHDLASLTASFRNVSEPLVWGTFYDIRRYGGLQIFLRALTGGGSFVLSSPGEPVARHLARLAASGVTHLSGTPSHWRRALMSGAARSIAPRLVRLSGEIADQAILDELRAVYPQARIVHAYASTEAGVGFEVTDGLEGFPTDLVRVGVTEVDIRIVENSLRLRSRRTGSGYVGRTAAALRDGEEFVDTGDLVERQGERYRFIGRKGGIINVGGHKVHPEEVEAAINRHPGVAASLAHPRRSPITGAVVVADVILKQGMAADHRRCEEIEREIMAACRSRLAPYQVPAALRFVPAIELTVIGKLAREGLG